MNLANTTYVLASNHEGYRIDRRTIEAASVVVND